MHPRTGRQIPVILAGLLLIIFSTGFTGCYFTSTQLIGPNLLTAWTSDIWVTTTTAEFNAGVPMNVNTSNDEVKLNRTMGSISYFYALAGGNIQNFTRYNPATNTWDGRANTLTAINAGGALAFDGTYLYALAGGGSQNFTRYNPATNAWEGRTNTLTAISAGGALAFDGTYIYALAGGGSQNFTRYNPATDAWEGRANTLTAINAGGALAFDGTYLYALAGGGSQNFTRYNPATNTWEGRANVPDNVDTGGALTYGGSNYLYAFTGRNGRGSYTRYDTSTNTWLRRDNFNNVRAGGAVAYDGSTYIYALRGDNSQVFQRYNEDTWTPMANTLVNVNWGGALVYVPGAGASCYSSPGTIASIVFDTTTPGSRWDVLMWNATVPEGTTITFEVRASDTSFGQADAPPPDWTSVGGTSPVYPIVTYGTKGRYFQWRATLTSTDCANTPVLYDVTVYYTDP